MSRGLGGLERRILREVRRPNTFSGEVRWRIAIQANRLDDDGEIAHAFVESYRRAVKRLVRKRLLRRASRRLATVEEIVRFSPDRTLSLPVRDMRRRLLPAFARIVAGAPPRYGPVDNERWAFSTGFAALEPSDARRRRIAPLRRQLDREVAEVFAGVAEQRPLLTLILAKVSEYLDAQRVHKVGVPLRRLLGRVRHAAKAVPALRGTADALGAVCNVILPATTVRRATLKDYLTPHVELHRGSHGLKIATKNRLFEMRPSIVKRLDGHKSRVPPKPAAPGNKPAYLRMLQEHARRSLNPLPPTVDAYSPRLDQLVGKDALSWFVFLSPGTTAKAKAARAVAARDRRP
jgi:hypothetical protein